MTGSGDASFTGKAGLIVMGNRVTGTFNQAGLQTSLTGLREGGLNTLVMDLADGRLGQMGAVADELNGIAVGGGIGEVTLDGNASVTIGNGSIVGGNEAGYESDYDVSPLVTPSAIGFGGGLAAFSQAGGNATVDIGSAYDIGEMAQLTFNKATTGGGGAAAVAFGGNATIDVGDGATIGNNTVDGRRD